MNSCRDCGAPIRWARWVRTGKAVPINPEPDAEGNFLVDGDVVQAYAYATSQERKGERYTVHLDTCPKRKAS